MIGISYVVVIGGPIVQVSSYPKGILEKGGELVIRGSVERGKL